MAVIRRTEAKEPLSSGSVVSYPSGSPIGPAISQAGNIVQGVADRWQRQKEQFDNFKLGIANQQLDLELAGDLQSAAQDPKLPPGMEGFHDGFVGELDPETNEPLKPGRFDERVAKIRETLPEGVRSRFDEGVGVLRQDYSNKAAAIEFEGRQRYYDGEIGKLVEKLAISVSQIDPDDTASYQNFVKQGEDLILASGLPAADRRYGNSVVRGKESRIVEWRQTASEAVFQALLAKDPKAAKAALGIDAPAGDVVDRIIGVESGGNATAKNPNSSATGAGQFRSSTWMATVKNHEPQLGEGKSRAEILALRNDPVISRRMVSYLAQDNGDALRRAEQPVTDGTIYLAHFAGSQGAVDLLKADPTASAESVLGSKVVRANPFLKGMNAGEVVAWADRKMGSTAAGVDRVDPRFRDIPVERRFQLYLAAKAREDEVSAVERVTVAGKVADDIASLTTTGTGVGGLDAQRVTDALGEQRALEWANDRQAAHSRFQAIDGMATMTDEELSGRLESLRPAPGATGFDAAIDTYDAAEKEVTRLRAERADDPAESVKGFPEIGKAAVAWDTSSPEARRTSWINMMRARLSAQERIGIVPSLQLPLTKEEAKQFAAPIRAAAMINAEGETGDWFGMVDQLAAAFKESFGEYQDEAFRQVMMQLVGQDTEKALFASNIIKGMIEDQALPLEDVRAFDTVTEIQRTESVARQFSGATDPAYTTTMAGRRPAGSRLTSSGNSRAKPPGKDRPYNRPEADSQVDVRPRLDMPTPDDGDRQYLKDNPETVEDFISIFGEEAVPEELR